LTHSKANQPEACHLYALLGMAPEVVHVDCGVSAAPKQKKQQPDPVLARDSNHFTSVLRRLFGQGFRVTTVSHYRSMGVQRLIVIRMACRAA
jgi:hypothetical protein